MKIYYFALAVVLLICFSVPTIANTGGYDEGIAITACCVDTDQGLWAWAAHGGGGMDVLNISSLQINMPIANEGITGNWQSWGPGYWNPDGSSAFSHINEFSDWTVEFGNWQSSPNLSYVKWTAPEGEAISLNANSGLFCFFLKVPSTLRQGNGIGHIYLTDSTGNVGEEDIYFVPTDVVPEPGSLAALGLGLVPMAEFVLRKRCK